MMRGQAYRWGMGMAGLLAWRNLAHDRSRFVVTLVGISFAVVLIAMQIGLFLGFTDSATSRCCWPRPASRGLHWF